MRQLVLVVGLAACSVEAKHAVNLDGGVDATPSPDAPDDDSAPDTMITSAPDEFSREGSASFQFTSDEATAVFQCSIDGETPVACNSPYTRTLGSGAHTFSVRAIDAAGNGDDTPAEHLWSIDMLAPETMLVDTPPLQDNSVMVMFTFTSTEENVTFDCSLDNSTYAVCTSGASVGPIADGPHSFAVRARDRAGNVDASPAVHAWSVDTSTPDTQILSGPPTASSMTTASFTFVSPDAGSGATYQCSLDNAAFTVCTSPKSFTGLTEREHTFEVRVRDAVGNLDPSPATRTWTVDLTAPNTTILTGPSGVEAQASASFTFTASEADVTYACSLDSGAYSACTSPANFTALGQGAHTFAVRATDSGGLTDATPATRTWTVDTVAPEVMITSGPANAGTSGPRVTFAFTVSDGAVACSLDSAPFAACTSPLSY
ncbi:MAG: cell envelope biogenesis protein OmpA, partial [Deltaproteobacteria bacterium]|nr:cell envelope biogenesis protein OmpA [Deltaproteobacteria bacterium]